MRVPGEVLRAGLALLLLFEASCLWQKNVESNLANRQYRKAYEELRKNKKKYRSEDRVLYFLDAGLLGHFARVYRDSLEFLERAERESWLLYTKRRAKLLQAEFHGDGVHAYEAEDYELVVANVVRALTFLELENADGALVEARRLRELLERMRASSQGTYRDDAFARWFVGRLYELEGSYEDARIAYQAARQLYEGAYSQVYRVGAPSWLSLDVARATLLSRDPKLASALNASDREAAAAQLAASDRGELIVVHLYGRAPKKKRLTMKCNLREAEGRCDHAIGSLGLELASLPAEVDTVPVPIAQHPGPSSDGGSMLRVITEQSEVEAQTVSKLDQISWRAYLDELPALYGKATSRARLRQAAVGVANGHALQWPATLLVGQAGPDVRSWWLLPQRIEVARVRLPAGQHKVVLASGRSKIERNVTVRRGGTTFMSHYSP